MNNDKRWDESDLSDTEARARTTATATQNTDRTSALGNTNQHSEEDTE